MRRYCFFCTKKINHKGGRMVFCSLECKDKHNRELAQERMERFLNKLRKK